MDIEYYIIVFTFSNNEKYYTIWYTSDDDGFILNNDGLYLQTFTEEKDLHNFAIEHQYKMEKEVTEISCEESNLLNFELFDCELLLDFWNTVSDVAKSTNIFFVGDSKDILINEIYDKLFYGCNLSAYKKDGQEFIPEWMESEKTVLSKIVKEGQMILKEKIKGRII